jgi:DNA (cytosine-5)-methyltransferase 1
MTTFIDLFSGCGGLTAGLERAGWESQLDVDAWPDAVRTFRSNFPDHKSECLDIHDLDAKLLAGLLDETPDWVVGGPPCQGFSTVGRRKWDDERNELITEFKRVVAILEPEKFLIENVLGLRDMGAAQAVVELFEQIGYSASFQVVSAADFGVPQLRRRVLFVGSRSGEMFGRVPRSHSESNYVTVSEAIGDLPEVGPGEVATEYDKRPGNAYQREMRKGSRVIQGHHVSAHPPHLVEAISHIPDGGNRTSIPPNLQPRSGFHNSYARLASWLPAVAVTSNLGKPSATRCVHPSQDRGLTAREGARLQSFPDRFHFHGGIVSQRLQIANAVPVRMGCAIGAALEEESNWGSAPEAALLAAA